MKSKQAAQRPVIDSRGKPAARPASLSRATLRIGQRIGIGFAVVILLMMCVTAIGLLGGERAGTNVSRMVNQSYPQSVQANMLREQINQTSRSMSQLIFLMTVDEKKREKDKITAARATAAQVMGKLTGDIADPDSRALLKVVQEAKQVYDPQVDGFLKLIDDSSIEQARDLALPQLAPLEQRYLDAINALIQRQGKEIEQVAALTQSAVGDIRLYMLAVSAAAVVLAIVIGLWTTRSVTRPLAEAVSVAKRVADGDLSSDIREAGEDETGHLLRALKAMNEGLRRIVSQVREGTHEMEHTSREIESGCAGIADRTENQARAIELTASSIDELNSTVAQNAANADKADHEMHETLTIANRGGALMSEVVGTMVSIKESSDRIAEIIGVIDGIAFQTNILALNAAVEAARAGEAGRGFAVVASEVRALAQRSAGASKEIRGLIQDSVSRVNGGKDLVDKAGSMMQNMVVAVQHVASLVAEIADASKQQSSGIEEVSKSIALLDQMAQQNAAFVEEAAAAAESMHVHMRGLVDVVSLFKGIHPGEAAVTARVEAPADAKGKAKAPAVQRLAA